MRQSKNVGNAELSPTQNELDYHNKRQAYLLPRYSGVTSKMNGVADFKRAETGVRDRGRIELNSLQRLSIPLIDRISDQVDPHTTRDYADSYSRTCGHCCIAAVARRLSTPGTVECKQ